VKKGEGTRSGGGMIWRSERESPNPYLIVKNQGQVRISGFGGDPGTMPYKKVSGRVP